MLRQKQERRKEGKNNYRWLKKQLYKNLALQLKFKTEETIYFRQTFNEENQMSPGGYAKLHKLYLNPVTRKILLDY